MKRHPTIIANILIALFIFITMLFFTLAIPLFGNEDYYLTNINFILIEIMNLNTYEIILIPNFGMIIVTIYLFFSLIIFIKVK